MDFVWINMARVAVYATACARRFDMQWYYGDPHTEILFNPWLMPLPMA